MNGNALLPMIPDVVIFDHVLCRLPVKSLLRFRCVSKSWNSLIDHDRRFMDMHLELSRKHLNIFGEGDPSIFLSAAEEIQVVQPLSNGERSLLGAKGTTKVRSSCDGLFCLESSSAGEPLHVVNLAMRKSRSLPLHRHHERKANICRVLYDSQSAVYKVLVVYSTDDGFSFSQICSLLDDCWWRVIYSSFGISRDHNGCDSLPILGGEVHWINGMQKCADLSIITFDITREKFRTVIGPKACNGQCFCTTHTMHLYAYRGFLHLVHINSFYFDMEVWVLKEAAWIKLHSVGRLGPDDWPEKMKPVLEIRVPLALYVISVIDGEILWWVKECWDDTNYLVSFSSRRNEFRLVIGPIHHHVFDVFPCVESLLTC